MDLKFIEDLLKARIDPDTGVLRLSSADAAPLGPPIVALYGAYFNDTDFTIDGAGISRLTQPDRVLLTGTGSSFPFEGVPIRAYFTVSSIDDNDAALDLVASPGTDWMFDQSYPVLGGTFFSWLTFTAPGFALRSEDMKSGKQGLSFAGTMQLTGPNISFVTKLLGGLTTLEVTGAITTTEDMPVFTLAPAKDTNTPAIGDFLPFQVRIAAIATIDEETSNTALQLQGLVTYKAEGKDRTLVFGVDLLNVPFAQMHFNADVREADLHIGQIVQLLNGLDAAPTLPPVFSVLDNLTLHTWDLYINADTLSPTGVGVAIGTRQPWTLVPDTLDVSIDRLSLFVSKPQGSWLFATDLLASFVLDQDGNPATIKLSARYPGFEMRGWLADGTIDVKWMLGKYISKEAGDLVGAKLEVDKFSLYVAPSSGSFAFALGISTEWPINIGIGSFTVMGLSLAVSRLAQVNSALFEGKFRLGTLEPPVLADVSAGYSSNDGWAFEGGLTPTSTLSLSDLLQSYFPSWDLSWTTIELKKFRVWFRPKSSATYYRFVVEVLWTLQFGDYSPGAITGEADIAYTGSQPPAKQYVGYVKGQLDFSGLRLGVDVRYPEKSATLTFNGLTVDIQTQPETWFKVTFPQKTLGDLIAMLVSAASGRNYTLPAPWDILNLIDLSDFELQFYPNRTPKEYGVIWAPKNGINLWFLTLSRMELWYRKDKTTDKAVVDFAITGGSFLGVPITTPIKQDVLNPASAPKVPGAGTQMFSLDFLAVGQRVALKTAVEFKSVVQAEDELEKAFKPQDPPPENGSPIAGTKLVASDSAGWLFGLRATLLSAIELRIVFLDPELYGLAISVSGTKFPKLTGLKFEILYKKINETIGVYQIELRVPDFMRQLEFGSVSITLPIIGIEIFTNGNFRLDFGFPANGDFTRSFAIQVLPFTGAGGFYFGWLTGATSKRVPQTTHGNFNPVIEAGIGLRLGIGKDINKGILKAGLSLTVVGIIEGTLAFYHPNNNDPKYDNAMYYWVSGSIALVGQIYGEINFAIISARLDILVKIGVGLIVEALEPITFTFIAEVSVKLSVRINLGIFSFSISLSFGATISEKFTMGSGNPNKPWNYGLVHPMSGGRAIALDQSSLIPLEAELVFHPVTRTMRAKATLYFTPQFEPASPVANGVIGAATAQCVAMLYAPTTVGQPDSALVDPSPFDEVARGTLVWTLAAALFPKEAETPYDKVVDETITVEKLQQILATLDRTSTAPLFDGEGLISFFQPYFEFTVKLAPKGGVQEQVAVFPMLTPFTLKRPDGTDVPFATHQMVGASWFTAVRDYFKQLAVDYLNPERKAFLATAATAAPPVVLEQSIAAWMMVDYFNLLAKGAVQAAIDTVRGAPMDIADHDSLESLSLRLAKHGITVESLARANLTRPLRGGARLQVPPFWRDLRQGETRESVSRQYGVAATTVWSDDSPRAEGRYRIPRVRVRNVVHQVPGDANASATANANSAECLLGIARSYGVSPLDLAAWNSGVEGLFAPGRINMPEADSMKIKDLLDRMQETAQFEHLAGSTSRVLLHGLRPPAPPGDQPTAALYALNGQQFDVSTLKAGLKAGGTFDLSIAATLPWLLLESSDPLKITVTISSQDEGVIAAFNNATLVPSIDSIAAMPFSETQGRSYGLGNAIAWRPDEDPALAARVGAPSAAPVANAKHSLWSFPRNLVGLLQEDDQFRPTVKIVESTNDAPDKPLYDVSDLLPVSPYAWAARIDLTIRQVHASNRELIPSTYELWGGDVAGAATIQHLLQFDATSSPIDALYVLYAPNPVDNPDFNGLISKALDTTSLFLIQTNLSTEANPDTGLLEARRRAAAAEGGGLIGMTAQDFVRLVWESSVVRSGGFYVYYHNATDGEGLPAYLFNATDEITVSLLVTYKNTDRVLQPYMNTLAVARDIDVERTMFALQVDLLTGAAAEDEDDRYVQRAPTVPPGAVGFLIERTPPVTPPGPPPDGRIADVDPTPFIAQAYNLLNYQIAQYGGFDESPFGMPAGPADDDEVPDFHDPNRSLRPQLETDKWRYKGVIPVYRYASSSAAMRAGDDPVVPNPDDNPYRGIGTTVGIAFSWLDLFGNTMPVATPSRLDVPVHYTDHLFGIDRWPSITADYIVQLLGSPAKPTLQVRLRFNSGRYTDGSDEAKRAALADLAVYQLIYFQLHQPGMNASVSSSLDNTPTACIEPLKAYSLQIWQFLNGLVNGPPAPAPTALLIEPLVADLNPQQIFTLTVTMSIARPASLVRTDEGKAAADPVQSVASPIGVRYDESEPGAPLTIRDFTQWLEEAFPNLAVATAAPRAQSNSGGSDREIWLVRFGGTDGIVCDITPDPVFIAPLPLSRRLLSTRLLLHAYESGTPIADTPTHEQQITTIDIELLAREFVQAVDLFLSPQFVVPGWLTWNQSPAAARGDVETNPIHDVLAAKKSLAASIAARIGPVFNELTPTPSGLTDAQQKIEQQLLIRLSDLYTIDAIVQFPATITSRYDDPKTAPGLFGKTQAVPATPAAGDDEKPQDYSISTSNISLANTTGASFLTFLFGTRDPSAAAQVTLPLAFQRSHVQHDRVEVPGSEYEASQWLAFVTLATDEPTHWRAVRSRSRATDLGIVSIPVPLRAYPPAPALLSQRGDPMRLQVDGVRAPASINPELDEAKQWVFSFAYNYEAAGQDTIHATVQFNLAQTKSMRAKVGDPDDPDLLDALVQFSAVYPPLLADLESSLISQPNHNLAVTTMQSFAWLAERVRKAWTVWPQGRALLDAEPGITVKLTMRQHAVHIDKVEYAVFAVTMTSQSSGREYHPVIALEGYETEPYDPPIVLAGAWSQTYVFVKDGKYLPDLEGRAITQRTVQVPGLDVLVEQNARAGIFIRRNETLSDTYTTSEAFIYETPEMWFGSVLVPVLTPTVSIDVAKSANTPPTSDKLYQYLFDFLIDYFTPASGPPPVSGGVLRLAGAFEYALDHQSAQKDPFNVTIPIYLTQPALVSTETEPPPDATPASAVARTIADFVITWCRERELTGRASKLRLEVTLYAAQGDEQLPLLELNDVYLDMELVWTIR